RTASLRLISVPTPSVFFNPTATTEISTLSLHDALPIFGDHATLGQHLRPASVPTTSSLQSLRLTGVEGQQEVFVGLRDVLADDDLTRCQHRGLGVGATPARNLTTLGEGQRNRGDLLADREFLVQLVPGPDQALVERILDRPPDRVGGSLAYPVELRLGPLRGVRHRRAGALHAAFEAVERSPLRGDGRADHVLGTPPVEVGGVPGLAHRVAGGPHGRVSAGHAAARPPGGGTGPARPPRAAGTRPRAGAPAGG